MRSKIIFIFVIFLIINNSYAGTCSLSSSSGALDTFLNDFYANASRWQTSLLPTAIKLYWFWFTAELLYQITFKKVLANDVNKLWYFMMVRVFTGYMFANIFVDPAFYTGVINYFVKLGGIAGGFNITPVAGNPFGSLSPSAVMDTGGCVWDSAWKVVGEVKTGWWPTDNIKLAVTVGLPIILITLAVYILAAIMALTLFMTALESYIVMNAGIILCGFAGSSWTQGFWNKYLSYVGGIAIRLFVMCLILGIIQKLLISDLQGLSIVASDQSIEALPALMGVLIKLLIDVLICTFLVVKVPSMAGSMLTGSVNAGLGDVIKGASMMLAGAGLAAGLSKMGINMAGAGGSGGSGVDAAKEAFKDSLRGNGSGGLPSSGGSSSGSGATRTASQTAKSAMSAADKAKGIAELSGLKQNSDGGYSPANSGSEGNSGTNNNSSPSSGGNSSNSSGVSNNSSSSSQKNNSTGSGGGESSNVSDSTINNDSLPTGGISGNSPSKTNSPSSSKNQSSNNDLAKKRAKISQDMIKNKDKLIKSAQEMASGSHSGAAEINVSPHRHE